MSTSRHFEFMKLKLFHFLMILALLPMLVSSCSKVQIVVSFPPELQRLRDGEREFELGNYSEADAIFSEIYHSDASPQTKNTALYNLTCTRIITADNSSEFMAAVELLDEWKESFPSVIYVENPNLVIAALREQSDIFEESRRKAEKDSRHSAAVIAEQSEKIAELRISLKTLQHQIEELETIDQQIQEKKKPL